MTNASLLQGYRYNVLEIEYLQDQLREISGQPDKAQKLRDQLVVSQTRLLDQCMMFEYLLSRISDARTRTVLRSYYALGKSDFAISIDLNVCPRTVNRVRTRWLRIFGPFEALPPVQKQ